MKARILEKTPLYEGFLKLYRYRFEVERHGGGARVSSPACIRFRTSSSPV